MPTNAPVMDLLRFATVGSVDDGKSTLIGRLLVDTRQLFDDQLEAVAHASISRGVGDLDLSFVTDGLRAEREQGITIDVAYRYAATPSRKFIIADCPGHVQYTRNMATGASTADLALVVVDATAGLKEQTRRHLCIAALLGVRRVVVAANKMDLAEWAKDPYDALVAQVGELAGLLAIDEPLVVPVSALHGDYVVEASAAAPWYRGPTVLGALEAAPAGGWAGEGLVGARLPVQWVLRHPTGKRTYAGMVDGAALRPGDTVVVLPGGVETTVRRVATADGDLAIAPVGRCVDVDLADDTPAGRGDLLATAPLPQVVDQLTATVCWFGEEPLTAGQRFRVKHTTRTTVGFVDHVVKRFDVNRLALEDADTLEANDIGVITLTTADPLVVDAYTSNRITGSFVLVDERTNATLAGAMVGAPSFARDHVA
jgi:sulfate adenylyltransferase large subunit